MKNEEYYDEFSAEYDKQRLKGYFGFVNEMETAVVKPLCQNKSVLEIGCGTGLILQGIAKEARNAVGIDISSEMLQKAKQKGLSVARADATLLPFKSSSFDVVFSFKVLAHVEEIEKALLEAARVAKKNGFVLLEFYNAYSIKRLSNFFVRKRILTRYDSLADIKAMLPKNLSIKGVKGIRVVAPSSVFFRLPLINSLTKAIERLLSKTSFKFFGSYFVIICKKK